MREWVGVAGLCGVLIGASIGSLAVTVLSMIPVAVIALRKD